MKKMMKSNRDVFALSLGGVTAVTSFCNMPVIPHERLRKVARDSELEPRPTNWRLLMSRRHRVA